MPYITDRVVHDADSHAMELPHWFSEFGTDLVKKAFGERFNPGMDLRSLPKLHRSTLLYSIHGHLLHTVHAHCACSFH